MLLNTSIYARSARSRASCRQAENGTERKYAAQRGTVTSQFTSHRASRVSMTHSQSKPEWWLINQHGVSEAPKHQKATPMKELGDKLLEFMAAKKVT